MSRNITWPATISRERGVRPLPEQLNVLIEFLEKHPQLAWGKFRDAQFEDKRNLWEEISHTMNTMTGSHKTTSCWMKYWCDKRRSVLLKRKYINQGKISKQLDDCEQRILNLYSSSKMNVKKKEVKQEPNKSNESCDDIFFTDDATAEDSRDSREFEERNIKLMDVMVDALDMQAAALSEIAKESTRKSKAISTIAEASHKQACSIDNLSSAFKDISQSMDRMKDALKSIDYTVKKCFLPSNLQSTESATIFYIEE
ncbi:unnamed protein product [Leptosia nina]|uniref:Regulatory protein zeste n=1 Tax=Leptosia nina TaxID=320188 RepID=A0AAV1IUV4_9NEOP